MKNFFNSLFFSQSLNALNLAFEDVDTEQAYIQSCAPTAVLHSRISMLVAMLSSITFLFIEPLLIAEYSLGVGLSTFGLIMCIGFGLSLSYLPVFLHRNQAILVMLAFVYMVIILVKQIILPPINVIFYFPAFIIAIFWICCFASIRFKYVILLMATSGTISLCFYAYYARTDLSLALNYIFYTVVSVVLATIIAYQLEKADRQVFLTNRDLALEKEKHHHRSMHDALTGLPNRDLLADRIEQAMNLSMRTDIKCAGFFIDIDYFKQINDQHGHRVGDLFLQEVAKRLRNATRDTDTVSRVSGDEFFLLAVDIKNEKAVAAMAEKLKHQLAAPFKFEKTFVLPGVTASMGAVIFPYKHCTPLDIINRADQAMYRVKRFGKDNVLIV